MQYGPILVWHINPGDYDNMQCLAYRKTRQTYYGDKNDMEKYEETGEMWLCRDTCTRVQRHVLYAKLIRNKLLVSNCRKLLLIATVVVSGKVGPFNKPKVNHTGWMTVVAPTVLSLSVIFV